MPRLRDTSAIIPTEPIGSIPRPRALIEAVRQRGHDDSGVAAMYEAAVHDTIERMEPPGPPVITDGEQRKYHNFWAFAKIAARVRGTALAATLLGKRF